MASRQEPESSGAPGERPLTDPAQTRRDLVVLRELLQRERVTVMAWRDGRSRVRGPGERSPGPRRELLVVPDAAAVLAARDVTVVGFFGELRAGINHEILFEFERRVTETFAALAGTMGLLSYYDAALDRERFGNLILFATSEGPRLWRANAVHGEAVATAPVHYESIRLHRGWAPGPFGSLDIRLEHTTYIEFRGGRIRRTTRVYDASAPAAA